MSLQNASIKVAHFIIGGFDTVRKPIVIGAVILVTYLLALFANMANIMFIISDKRLHKPMYLLICNLAVVDILYTSSSSPTMIGVLLAGVNTISYVECLIQMCIFHLGAGMESFVLAVMGFDRLIAIIYPFHYRSYLTNTRTLVLTYFLWIVGWCFVSFIPATVVPLPHCTSRLKYAFCDYAAVIRTTCVDPEMYFNFAATIAFIILFSTFILICLSYCGIFCFVKLSSRNEKRKMWSTVVSHLICVIIHYCPAFIHMVLTRFGVVLTLEERQGLLIGAVISPCLVNPFVYCLSTKEIKNKIFKIFRKREERLIGSENPLPGLKVQGSNPLVYW
ncbi:olfactory receptor 6F1-like [Archocentrus centrarchus]|uniref:olfactory receptor 6F1-like n=1 Tax=Archocentrus centrarchus TaxID=63155 RepID=UPI0011EA1DCA|nr:olfactory receptor 6F1-like [Archocentrus centrarchus]